MLITVHPLLLLVITSIKMALNRLPQAFKTRLISLKTCRCSSSSAASPKKVKIEIPIPDRIERGPTDILKALASTIKRVNFIPFHPKIVSLKRIIDKQDMTAAHYKYMDDPFFIPQSNLNKRSFALSKESGRRAARYFLDKYPHLFYRDDAEPKIAAFSYKDTYNIDTEYDESDLINCTASGEVLNSIQVYKSCLKREVPISSGMRQSLLEMVSFYNSQDGPDLEFLEENWFKSSSVESVLRKTWNDASFAEELFQSISEKTPETYEAMIRGYAKHNAGDKAFNMYQECKENNMPLGVETYNHVIKIIPFLRESGETRWELLVEILRDMNLMKVRPNLNTFNEMLEMLLRLPSFRERKNNTMKILSEMKSLNIDPSLATYYYITTILNERGPTSPVLYEVMRRIEGKSFTLRHPKDIMFFVNAMSICNESLNDVSLAYRIHDLLQVGDNQKLLGDSYRESVYYQNFFKLLATSESIEEMMDMYDKYVPNFYTPEPSVMDMILSSVDLYAAYHYIPQLWNDILVFEYDMRERIVTNVLKIIGNAKLEDEKLRKSFLDITTSIFDKIDTTLNQESDRYSPAQNTIQA